MITTTRCINVKIIESLTREKIEAIRRKLI